MRYETEKTGRQGHPDSTTDTLARSLGVFSVALGVLEFVAAGPLSRAIGMPWNARSARLCGLREIGTGAAILGMRDAAPGIWGRVAGDAVDILTLSRGLSPRNPRWGTAALAFAAVAGVTALDVYCAQVLARESPKPLRPSKDYRNRSGFPRRAEEMRGAARKEFHVPPDFRQPDPQRPMAG